MAIRFVFSLMTVFMFIAVAGFVLTNMDARVSITFWKTPFEEIRLVYLVILAVIAGVVYAGVIAVVEGATIRLENKRLRKAAAQLEAELNDLRTSRAGARPEPDEIEPRTPIASASRSETETRLPPSAPVYVAEPDSPDDGVDDDAFSGGRTV